MLFMIPSTLSSSELILAWHYIAFIHLCWYRRNVEKRNLLDRLEAVFLIIDELVDGG